MGALNIRNKTNEHKSLENAEVSDKDLVEATEDAEIVTIVKMAEKEAEKTHEMYSLVDKVISHTQREED